MTPEQQNRIDRIKHISEAGLIISLCLLLVLLLIPNIWSISFPQIVDTIITKTLLSVLFISIAVLGISSIWATNEEREQQKSDMKEILREIKAEEKAKPRPTIFSEAEIHIPLKGLTPEQTSIVHGLLQKIPVTGTGVIRNSELMAFIRALSADDNLDDGNLDEVVRWVEYVTEQKVDAAHFKSEYNYRPTDKNITKMGDLIRREFDKLR